MSVVYAIVYLLTNSACGGVLVESTSSTNATFTSNSTYRSNTLSRQAGYDLVRFEGQPLEQTNYGFVTFGEASQSHPLKFEDQVGPTYTTVQNDFQSSANTEVTQNHVTFQNYVKDDSNYKKPDRKRRRKRRRKSRRWLQGADVPQINHKPPYVPEMSIVKHPLRELSGPLGFIESAFASIIENDDKQCLLRSLCEQAAGKQLVNSSVVNSITNLMQYLPGVTRAFGVNSYPIFEYVAIFSAAVKVGTESKNESICVKSFPKCPSDPEERIAYLNNHKGGIFRFFNGSNKQKYTPEEFHNKIIKMGLNNMGQPVSAQYGVYSPGPGQHEGYAPWQYGAYNPAATQNVKAVYSYPGQYGLQQQNPVGHRDAQQLDVNQLLINQIHAPPGMNSGFSRPNVGYVRPSPPLKGDPTYGSAYPHYRRFISKAVRVKNNKENSEDSNKKIQDRIQNKPVVFVNDSFQNNDVASAWSFPQVETYDDTSKVRDEKYLKFPEKLYQQNVADSGNDNIVKGFFFPGEQSNRQYLREIDEFASLGGHLDYNDKEKDGGLETVYVVRGNGDPYHPEIIKLRPGDKIQ